MPLAGPSAMIVNTVDRTLASANPAIRIVPNGMWRLFQERRTASQWSRDGGTGACLTMTGFPAVPPLHKAAPRFRLLWGVLPIV